MSGEEEEANSGADEPVAKKVFKFVDALAEVPKGDAAAATALLLQDRGLTTLESLEACKSLQKLELKGNYLTDLAFVEMNSELCWLGLAQNRLRRLAHLENLSNLAVLDISDNKIVRLSGLRGLTGLKALIAARNRIIRLDGLSPKRHPNLETIVMSHNSVEECKLVGFQNLKKLSLGHNKLHGFPKLQNLPMLSELRLNSNRLNALSKELSVLPKLLILDIGNNLFTEPQQLAPLDGLLWLKSLNLLGNAVAGVLGQESSPGKAMKALLDSLKRLEIVNNKRVVGTSSKKRKRPVEQEPVVLAVHGRTFAGKKAVFADSDEEPAAASKPKVERPKLGVAAAQTPKSKDYQAGPWRPSKGSAAAETPKIKVYQQRPRDTGREASNEAGSGLLRGAGRGGAPPSAAPAPGGRGRGRGRGGATLAVEEAPEVKKVKKKKSTASGTEGRKATKKKKA